jgi:DNA-binding transcriptional LysR family regulator
VIRCKEGAFGTHYREVAGGRPDHGLRITSVWAWFFFLQAVDRDGFMAAARTLRIRKVKDEVVLRLTPRFLSDDMISLKQAAIAGLGVVALASYVCREEVRSGAMRRVSPTWLADDSTITALIPYRQGLLPSVRAFLDHLAEEFPKPF